MSASKENKFLTPIKKDEQYVKEFISLTKSLKKQASVHIEYYQEKSGDNNERFYNSFIRLYDHLEYGVESGVSELMKFAHTYDFNEDVPANGYRSIISVIHKCCLHLKQLTRHISVTKDSLIFRSTHYSKELEAYVLALGQLRACLYYLQVRIIYVHMKLTH